jgi:hypothetical protein
MTTFLGPDFGFTGLGTWAGCPCWQDGDRLKADRWLHPGNSGLIEYDPIDRVALAFRLSVTLDELAEVQAVDDLSTRLRVLIRGRSFER